MFKKEIIKFFSIIIIFILICECLAPSAYALNNTQNDLIYNEIENSNKNDISNTMDETRNEILNDSEDNLVDESQQNTTNGLENNIKQDSTNETENNIKQDQTNEAENNIEKNNTKSLENVEPINIEDEEFSISVKTQETVIKPYIKNDIYYLFLPNGISLEELNINYTGKITNLSNGILDEENKTIKNDFSKNNTLTISTNEKDYTVQVLQSDLPSLSISLNGITLDEINNSSKDIKYKQNTLTLNTKNNEKQNFTDTDVEIKGRGNFTWKLPKRGYQIKLSSKKNVLGMGKAKTWILLANYADSSLLRNKITSDLAQELGLAYTGECAYVDLWVDGNYQGNYLLIEKVQVDKNRVNLSDENGIIAELDNNYYETEENYFVSNKSGTAFVLKDSVADDEEKKDSQSEKAFNEFRNYINEFETYLYSDKKDWKKISSMIDVESFIKYYFIQEFTEDPDGCRSSVFMYKDGATDKLHMGPIWDYDSALGNYTSKALGGNTDIDYIINIKKYMPNSNEWYTQLFQIKEFRKIVSDMYNNSIKKSLENVTTNITKNQSAIIKSAEMNFIKWDTLGKNTPFVGSDRINKATYNEEVQYLSNWVQNRVNYLNKRYSNTSDILNIKYTSHVQDYGWNNSYYSENGEVSGTEGKNKKLEAIKINLDTFNENLSEKAEIRYQAHVQDYGWMDWKENGEIAGTVGENKRMEAIKIELNNYKNYTVQYRVHVQDIGWQDWKDEGEVAGTIGQCLKIEAIQIRIVKQAENTITYTTHVQDIGWQANVKNGEIAGTEGKSLRLEGIKINILNNTENLKVEYSTHIQDIGWQDWKQNGEMSGTEGKCLRLEAIKIKLKDNEDYNIKYRVHIQDIGWQDWKENGEIAGTEGRCLRLEAIQIKLEKKNK